MSVLVSVRNGISARNSLGTTAAELRAGTQSLSFQVLRNLGRAEALCRMLAKRSPPPGAHALLCSALALAWQDAQNPFDNFTLVDQAVEAAKRHPDLKAQAPFINACLRRFLRERENMVAFTDQDLTAVWNHPSWWIKQLQVEQPQRWQAILGANNTHPPLTLRINARNSSAADYIVLLAQNGIKAFSNGPAGVTLVKPQSVSSLPGFSGGNFSVQDAAAQLAAPLLIKGLQTSASFSILDACAAPGGKTGHLLEIAQCDVLALDVDASRCERIRQNLNRLGLVANVVAADAAEPETWWDGKQFDAILLDAPCTASGIVRRHPDVRWLRRPGDVAALALVQSRLLQSLWPLLKPGGHMVYCTCSVFRAEGVGQIQTFLANNTLARLLPSPGQLMPQFTTNAEALTDNSTHDHDGFFLALLQKQNA